MALKNEQKAMLGVGGAAVLFLAYKRKKSGTGTARTVSVPTPVGGGVQPYTPQPITTLDPGQSIYDPNSEGFLGPAQVQPIGPGQSVFDPGGSGGIDTAPPPLQNNTPSGPGYVVNVTLPPQKGTGKQHRKRPHPPTNHRRGKPVTHKKKAKAKV